MTNAGQLPVQIPRGVWWPYFKAGVPDLVWSNKSVGSEQISKFTEYKLTFWETPHMLTKSFDAGNLNFAAAIS